MNYYEYAPLFFRWLFGNTNIKPWELFNYLIWSSVILAVTLLYFRAIRGTEPDPLMSSVDLWKADIAGIGFDGFASYQTEERI